MDQKIVDMLSSALADAQQGKISALAIITSDEADNASVGYFDRDQTTGLQSGAAFLIAAIVLNPEFDDALDAEFPARALKPICASS